MDLLRKSNTDGMQSAYSRKSAERSDNTDKRDASDAVRSGDSQYVKLGKDFDSAQKKLEDSPGVEAQNALAALLKRADNLTPKQIDCNITTLESHQQTTNASRIALLTGQRDACINELPEGIRREAKAIASLLERAKLEPKSPFMDCSIARWQSDLRRIAPAYAARQEQIDKLSTNDEIELLKGFKDLSFKGRLALAMTAGDASVAARRFTEMSEQFSDWELNRHFSKMSSKQAKLFDQKLQESRVSIFQNYWEIWNPEVQAKAQHIDTALGNLAGQLPVEKLKEAQQLIRELCEPKAPNDMVVSLFLLQHISPPLAEKAQQLSDLRAPLRAIEQQDKALDRLKNHLSMFGPVIPTAEIP